MATAHRYCAMATSKMKVVKEFRVAPPPGSLPTTISLPLTLFNLHLLISNHGRTVKNIISYAYPRSLHHLTETTIPSLKSSLSLALQHFYPFVSNLILPPSPQNPYMLFTQGNSVPFVVVHYSGDNSNYFDHLASNKIKDVKDLHSLVPALPQTRVLSDGTRVDSLLTIQVTLFPDQGICIGVGFCHSVVDGRSFYHFIKSWASLCRSNGVVKFQMPSFNNVAIEDPNGLKAKLLQMWHHRNSSSKKSQSKSLTFDQLYADRVCAKFVMTRAHIDKLRQHISNNSTNNGMVNLLLSSFVVTCSFVWVCLIKSVASSDGDHNDTTCRLRVPADMRNRIPEIPITYFGICAAIFTVDVKRSKLVAHNGLIVAARAIGNAIKELETNGASRAIENWVNSTGQILFGSPILTIAGSPKFDIYKTDFGWGFPKKMEYHGLGQSFGYSVFLSDCINEEGGIEIGMVLKRTEMETFTRLFYQNLTNSHL